MLLLLLTVEIIWSVHAVEMFECIWWR